MSVADGEGAGAQPAEPAPPSPESAPDTPSAPNGSAQAGSADQGTHQDHYTSLYQRIKDKPCHVDRIEVERKGFNDLQFRTRPGLIDRELSRIEQARTLEDIQLALETAGQNLAQLGVFNGVNFLVTEEPEDEPEACTVHVHLQEKNWYKIHAATYLQGGENTFEIGAGLHNATGRAEHLLANVEYGMENSHTVALSYEQPRILGLPLALELRGHQFFRNNTKASSFLERLRGAVFGLRSMDRVHAVQYELGWRSLSDPTRQASKAVLAQAGDYLKSCLRYTYTLDRRASPLGPLAGGAGGWAVRSSSELSGLGPDASLRYAKQQLDFAASVPMDKEGAVAFTFGATTGLMLPWGEADILSRTTCIADRFYIGGPSTLRGFGFKGVGPTDARRPSQSAAQRRTSEDGAPVAKRDALGGDAFASIFASLMFQLPHPALQALKVHGHAWVNGGNLIQVAGTGQSPKQLVNEFGSTFRWSCGFGVVLPTLFGRFEANYCVVLSHQEHDRIKRGLQLGFAANAFA